MRRTLLYSVPIIAVFSLIGAAVFNSLDLRTSGMPLPASYDDNVAFSQLNIKARAVNEGGGSAAVNDLVNELFTTFSTTVATDVKTRIVNSELLYQANQRGGVTETAVVQVVNGLKVKFNTPEFSKTDVYEVRKLRQALQLLAPQFVGHGRQSEQSAVGDVNVTIVPEMSPAEAVFVTVAMLNQKMSNPNYQLTQAERNAMWADLHSTKIGQAVEVDPTRTSQISNAIGSKFATMSALEILAVPHRALDILGIEP